MYVFGAQQVVEMVQAVTSTEDSREGNYSSIINFYIANISMAQWSSSMILASGFLPAYIYKLRASGPGFNSRLSPYFGSPTRYQLVLLSWPLEHVYEHLILTDHPAITEI